ncbi:MAG: AraC family transcriptional regulator of adaptative response / DNA-3-methyladenine glycosylase II [Porticoccus sp.]|jgi:AraC family transcriptional regulator of adaptative response / DNA-3-methyladenine glycosylase II
MASQFFIGRYNRAMTFLNDDEMTAAVFMKARLSRDHRFDGLFFTAVKTTGIYCRSICPARAPKESNVEYYEHAHLAQQAGFRPCLRCRPDSAPGSPAWQGIDTTVIRAKRLIDEGALEQGSVMQLASRLGVSDRYLRQLFERQLGVSPKSYALFQQCQFAKQLLHQTKMPITSIALAAGFNSVRRFNDCFKQQLDVTPSQLKKSDKSIATGLVLKLHYRPPYDWKAMSRFLQARYIEGLERADEHSYGRSFELAGASGNFTAVNVADKCRFDVIIEIDDVTKLKPVVNNIRRLLDLDTDIRSVEECLQSNWPKTMTFNQGLRLPGTWTVFEAGIRGILGQQVSIVAARKLVTLLVSTLGRKSSDGYYFPSAEQVATADLAFLKMPNKRRVTLRDFAQFYLTSPSADPSSWLVIKGIGPWTIDYAKMRGLSDPDIYLGGDLGVQKAIGKTDSEFMPEKSAPFRSYLTFQLWSQL